MELIVETVIKGWAIGLLAAAPMGPMGVYCLQQSLNQGYKSGLSTAAGIVLSDLTYALLTGFCLKLVSEFLLTHQQPLQLVGSVVLLLFGYLLFRQNPTQSLSAIKPKGESYGQKFATAYLLTLSNPFILFLFVSLFAQLHLFAEGLSLVYYIAGYSSLVVGGASWWGFLIYIVHHVSKRFNIRNLRIINLLFGGVIMLMALIAFVLALTAN